MGVEKDILLRVLSNETLIQQTAGQIRNEIGTLSSIANSIRAKLLREENAKLKIEIENAKQKLIALEKQNGIKQVPLPSHLNLVSDENRRVFRCGTKVPSNPIQADLPQVSEKPKVVKEKKKVAPVATEDAPIDVGRLDLRIGLIEEIKRHPDADTLYVLKVNCGNPPEQRTVCSGLVAHIPIESLANRLVVLLCNLKPAKMRGISSEAMVMCASANVNGKNKVEVLTPPKGSEAGDRVTCDGFQSAPDAVLNPKKKVWETVAPDLGTDEELRACYKGVPWQVQGKGAIVADTLKNANVK